MHKNRVLKKMLMYTETLQKKLNAYIHLMATAAQLAATHVPNTHLCHSSNTTQFNKTVQMRP